MESVALAALAQAIEEFNGDPERIYLTGLSMGGYGAWNLAARHPGRFAALAPVCGGIAAPSRPNRPSEIPEFIPAVEDRENPYASVAGRIGRTPVWVFHGEADPVVPVEESRRMVLALRAAGGEARYSEFIGVGHDSWNRAYAEPEFFPWLFSKRLNAGR
jgi:predicted peptidase